jgi:NADH-quinone oxidoreductase subunit C
MTMTDFAIRPEDLQDTLAAALGERAQKITLALGEVTVHVGAAHYSSVMQTLRDAPGCQFEQLVDLAGLDYSAYREVGTDGPRFGVTVHLLSVSLNQRVRVKVLCPDDDLPLVDSVNDIWNSASCSKVTTTCAAF